MAPQEQGLCLGLCLTICMRRPVVFWQQVKEPGVGQRKEAFLHQKEDNSNPELHATMQPFLQRFVGWGTQHLL